jgi:hypothetical protein
MSSMNHHWLRKLLAGKPHFVIGGVDDPYLLRWFVIPRNHVLNIYVHKFMRSDDDRALHDHPWWFVSIMLRGSYIEHTPKGSALRKAPSIAFRKAEHIHRVQLIPQRSNVLRETPCWTLIVTGRKARHWGFHCPKGFVPWEKFVAKSSDVSVTSQGCGEFE